MPKENRFYDISEIDPNKELNIIIKERKKTMLELTRYEHNLIISAIDEKETQLQRELWKLQAERAKLLKAGMKADSIDEDISYVESEIDRFILIRRKVYQSRDKSEVAMQ